MCASGFERGTWQSTLADDSHERSDSDLIVLGYGKCGRPRFGPALHHDMAAATPQFGESVLLQDAAHLASRQDA